MEVFVFDKPATIARLELTALSQHLTSEGHEADHARSDTLCTRQISYPHHLEAQNGKDMEQPVACEIHPKNDGITRSPTAAPGLRSGLNM
jgi:hypothetical protein